MMGGATRARHHFENKLVFLKRLIVTHYKRVCGETLRQSDPIPPPHGV